MDGHDQDPQDSRAEYGVVAAAVLRVVTIQVPSPLETRRARQSAFRVRRDTIDYDSSTASSGNMEANVPAATRIPESVAMARQQAPAPKKWPRQKRSQLTFDSILDAAAQLLIAHGYQRMTTNQVAQRAGVSVGSLYQYFPNKQALLCALQQRHQDALGDVLHEAFAASMAMSLEDGIRHNIASNFRAHAAERDLHRALAAASALLPGMCDDAFRDRVVGAICAQIDAHAIGESDAERAAIAELIYETVESISHRAIVDGRFGIDDSLVEAGLTAMVMGLLDDRRRRTTLRVASG
jgi:AcrR family transcriptional regulator